MTKRRKLLLAISSLVALAGFAIAVSSFFGVSQFQASDKLARDNQKAGQKEKSAQPIALDSTRSIFSKKACDLLDGQLAKKTIGGEAVKNDTLTTFTTAEYNSTSCEYNANNKKVTITIYEYPSAEKAAADKTRVETTQLVSEDGGRTTSQKPRQSAAGTKGKFVATASVTVAGAFDSEGSKQLLKEVIRKL